VNYLKESSLIFSTTVIGQTSNYYVPIKLWVTIVHSQGLTERGKNPNGKSIEKQHPR